jgi:hypothetical protein
MRVTQWVGTIFSHVTADGQLKLLRVVGAERPT